MKPRGEPIRPVGGFFGLALSEVAPVEDSVWNNWTREAKVVVARTARAALARLVAHLRPRHVWLPAYICPELASAADSASIRYYPLDDKLSPDCATLRSALETGDLVIAVDYFGHPPAADFRILATKRPDIIWVEDRAQALWLADEPWAEWQLFSPRKLLGVPDGGLLVTRGIHGLPEPITGHIDAAIAMPEFMRFEDYREADNATWYAAYRAREQALTAEALPATRLTRSLLERIAIGPLVAARRRNHAFLSSKLSTLAAWQAPAEGIAPFGFVISVDDAGALAARLAAERLFCARHWTKLPSNGKVFSREHALSGRLLTLPCDHRYDECDLEILVEAIERLV